MTEKYDLAIGGSFELEVNKAEIKWDGYEALLEEAETLAQAINDLEVTDDNVKASKKLLAEVRKKTNQLATIRKDVKNSILESFVSFEQQVKDIESVVQEAENLQRAKVRALDEEARERKAQQVAEIWDKRIEMYSFADLIDFNNFLQPTHLNKGTTLNKVEEQMVEFFTQIDTDLDAISSLPNGETIASEYFNNGLNLQQAMKKVNFIEATKKRVEIVMPVKVVEPEPEPVKIISSTASFVIEGAEMIQLAQALLDTNKIKYTKIEGD